LTRPDRQKAERFVAHLEPIQHQLAVYCSRALNRSDEKPGMDGMVTIKIE
jgi:hypothetical protein